MDYQPQAIFKVLIIGDSMVGKSCILLRFADDHFPKDIEPTIGVDCRQMYVSVRDIWLKLKLWDTAGQEKYRSITKSFYHGAHGALIAYDLTNVATFDNVPKWVNELKEVTGDVPFVLVGNKSDSPDCDDLLRQEAEAYAREISCLHYAVSAQEGENVKEAFYALCEMMLDSTTYHEIPDDEFRLRPPDRNACCC